MSEWIKIENRLPEFDDEGTTDLVLVCHAYEPDVMSTYETARFQKDGWDEIYVNTDGWNLKPLSDYTHWMPLPEPPKGEH